MKIRTLSGLAGLGSALIFTQPASAGYIGLSVTATLGPNFRNVIRVWALFTDPLDGVTVVYGSPTASTMNIQSISTLNGGPGSAFFNPVTSHGNAPTPIELNGDPNATPTPIPSIPNAAFDTFFTIGVVAGGIGSGAGGADETGNQSMPANFINGSSFSNNNAGWYTNGVRPQGLAGWTGDGDNHLRVLLMQLTVSSTSTVRGTINLSGVNNTALAGQTSFVVSGQTFLYFPAPGALSLLGLAGLVGNRRRRT